MLASSTTQNNNMAVANLNLPHFPVFDISEIETLPQRWKTYKQRFEILCTAIGVKDEKQKLSMLLTYVGEKMYEIYEQIITGDITTQTYEGVLTAFDTHFAPAVNYSYECYVFRQMKQLPDETLHQYYIRLKEQAAKCNFTDTDKEIKQQIELMTANNKLRQYSFQHQDKTLQEILSIGKTFESIKIQTEKITKSTEKENLEEDINAVRKRTTSLGKSNYSFRGGMSKIGPQQQKKCFKCGGNYPHPNSCPAESKFCNRCGKQGHFANCCRTKINVLSTQSPLPTNQSFYQNPINQITHSSSNPTVILPQTVNLSHMNYDSDEYLFTVYNDMSNVQKELCVENNEKASFVTTVEIENQTVPVLVDTGASINIMNRKTFNKINQESVNKIFLEKTNVIIKPYGDNNNPLEVMGKFYTSIERNSQIVKTCFFVVNTEKINLLSGTTALNLKLIEFNTCEKVNNCDFHFENNHVPLRLQNLIESYRDVVFTKKIGKIKDYKVKLHVDESIKPVIQKERRIPFALREKVNKELERLESEDIIEDVTGEPTDWLNPLVIVPKGDKDGNIRVCIDMREANKAITRTRYPTPTVEDLLVKLKGSAVFSKLDLVSAFHQIELDESSRNMTTFQSDTKIKRFKRLIFGVNSASEELQNTLRNKLADISGAMNIADDIIIYAPNDSVHDEILAKVLQKCKETGITLNLSKCLFCKTSLEFYGFIFSKEGMKPNPKKVDEIKNAKAPEDMKSLRSFLGLANYMKRFINDFSTLTDPLRELLKEGVPFIWTLKQEQAFEKLKLALCSDTCISYFDDRKETILYTDASPVGLSAILIQKTTGQNDEKIVAYSSRALTETEKNYSQIEKECLAIVYGCEKNRLYLLGREFTIYSDHKAIINILNNPKSVVPLRIERLTLRLQGYNFKIVHVKGEKNISDYPSRHPRAETKPNTNSLEDYVNFTIHYACPNAITLSDIKTETLQDKTMQMLVYFIKTGRWYELDKLSAKNHENTDLSELKKFQIIKESLTLNEEQNIILKDNRIVLPKILRRIAVQLAHNGHLGIEKTKGLLRTKVYFPDLDKLVDELIRACIPCQSVTKQKVKPPLQNQPLAKNVWQKVHIDYLGPFPNNSYILVMVDQRSKYPEIDFTSSTSCNKLIPILERIFSIYGIPEIIISDNGPPFQSSQLAIYFKQKGINHHRITPLWPRANGQVERFMPNLTKVAQTAIIEKKDWRAEIYRFLAAYRNSPHCTTNIPPSELMFNRKTNYIIPHYNTADNTNLNIRLESNHQKGSEKAEHYYNNNHTVKQQHFQIGDRVIVKQNKLNKFTPTFKPIPYRVIDIRGTMITAIEEGGGQQITRNISFYKKVSNDSKFPAQLPDIDIEHDLFLKQNNNTNIEEPQTELTRKSYPKRFRRPVSEWRKY